LHDLEGAFQTFNQVSEQLAGAYRVLENRVARLNEELTAARSERLQQLAEKERLANRLERLLTALPAGVVVLDGNGVVQETNPAACTILGVQLENRIWDEIADEIFTRGGDDGHDITVSSGKRINLSVSPLGSEPGHIILIHDVTEKRALQERLDRHRHLSAMGEMTASLAHQIRTPLASALLYAGNLNREGLEGEDRSRFTDKLISRLRYLENMVNDMLVFARGGKLHVERVALDGLVAELIQLLEQPFKSQGAEFKITDNVPAIAFPGNREALLGALQNLAINAMQAGESVRVSLSIATDDKNLILTMQDNGPGIEAPIRERIFEPFFTTRSNGTGLGLAVVRAVVLAHHGDIQLDSLPGQGTAFRIYIPLRDTAELLPSGSQQRGYGSNPPLTECQDEPNGTSSGSTQESEVA
jgi:two-component system sensor histidine kinase FlrB